MNNNKSNYLKKKKNGFVIIKKNFKDRNINNKTFIKKLMTLK